MVFCKNCGAEQKDDSAFCAQCGTKIERPASAPEVAYVPAGQAQPVQPNQTVIYAKPKVPGRGFGIAGMVLGIIGLVYGFFLLIGIIGASGSIFYRPDISAAIAVLIYSSLSIMGVAFGACGRKRGYINGVSASGLVMGIIGLIFYFIAIIIVLANM